MLLARASGEHELELILNIKYFIIIFLIYIRILITGLKIKTKAQ
jgi:hypothetical protein